MAPLPPNGTPRFRVNYFVSVVPHSFQIRSHASPSAVGTMVDDFLTALSPALFGMSIATVDFAADGSDVFIPVTTGIEGNTYGSGEGTVLQRPWFYGFQGRGATGRKWHLDIFGAVSLATNFRWSPLESEAIDNAVAIARSWGAALVDIADSEVTVYTYVNAGDNAHFQRKAR